MRSSSSGSAAVPLEPKADKGQRSACGCAASIDIRAYDTCLNGCRYCYANRSDKGADPAEQAVQPASPVLCDAFRRIGTVSERRMRSLQVRQLGWLIQGPGHMENDRKQPLQDTKNPLREKASPNRRPQTTQSNENPVLLGTCA